MSESLIVASGLSLTRNEALLPFPHVAREEELEGLLGRLESRLTSIGAPGEWQVTRLQGLPSLLRSYLVERGLMTPSFSQLSGEHQAFALYRAGKASLQINGDDHVLILGSRSGENLSGLWGTVNSVDDIIERQMTYAFDERYGYLASHPESAGTGLRAHVTLHLPGLMVTGRLGSLAVQLLGQGLTLTPLWSGAGALFQVSNRGAQGISELRMTEIVREASAQISERERAVRKKLVRENPTRVRDYMGRALGVAQQAWMVGVEEALGLLSVIQSGIEMQVVDLPSPKPQSMFRLMQRIQPGHLAVEKGLTAASVDDARLDQLRARILRRTFAGARVLDRRR